MLLNNRGAKVAQQSLSISDLLIIEPFVAAENAIKDAQTKLTAAENAAADAQSALDAAKKTVEDAKADIEKAKDELAKDQALKDALAAAQTEYDKYYLKAKPAHAQAATQAAAKAPARKATAKGLAQTGDTSSAAGEVFAIGGFTLVAAGVMLGDRRRKQM